MPSTFTPFLNLEKPGLGDLTNTWGNNVNANFDKIDTGVKANNTAAAPIPGMQTDISNLKTSDSTQNTNITNLQTTQNAHTTSINSNTSSINTINNTSIPNLQSQITALQNSLNALTSRVSAAE